jgi:hypothetical protein
MWKYIVFNVASQPTAWFPSEQSSRQTSKWAFIYLKTAGISILEALTDQDASGMQIYVRFEVFTAVTVLLEAASFCPVDRYQHFIRTFFPQENDG